ncbi:hypothetical protein B566_EDAN005614 [Ephemera danica]|nr:hypothetical protein B566_EDAN005614 [Ephemera danica]
MSTNILKMGLLRVCTRQFSIHTAVRSASQLTRVSQENGLLRITMSNPKKRNALSLQMLETLIDDMTGTQDDPTLRAIVIANDGPVFSAGHDLKELMIEDKQSEIFATCSHLMAAIRNSPVPVITAVRGLAAAAGCQLSARIKAPSPHQDADVDHIVKTIKAKPRDVVELGKKFLYQQVEMDIAAAFRMGENVMVNNLQYSNAMEGLASFAEKRKPKWYEP